MQICRHSSLHVFHVFYGVDRSNVETVDDQWALLLQGRRRGLRWSDLLLRGAIKFLHRNAEAVLAGGAFLRHVRSLGLEVGTLPANGDSVRGNSRSDPGFNCCPFNRRGESVLTAHLIAGRSLSRPREIRREARGNREGLASPSSSRRRRTGIVGTWTTAARPRFESRC